MSAVPDPARVALVFSWAHRAFDLLCDLEQVTAACANGERYQRLLKLLREHNTEISGRQHIVCKAASAGRAAVLVAPRRTIVLRSPPTHDDPYPVEPPLMDEEEALVAEGLVNKPVGPPIIGAALPTMDEIFKPMYRDLVS